MAKITAEDIYETLSRQSFANFYGQADIDTDNSPFGKHLAGDENAPSKEEILKKITQIFNLD